MNKPRLKQKSIGDAVYYMQCLAMVQKLLDFQNRKEWFVLKKDKDLHIDAE